MRLDTLIIADAVSTPANDKFYVHGGGITRIEIPQLPFQMPIAILLRFKLEEEDLYRQHQFEVVLLGPLGVPNIPSISFDAGPPPDGDPPPLAEGEERFVNVAVNVNAAAIRTGLYQLEVKLEGKLARRVPLPVVLSENAPQTPTMNAPTAYVQPPLALPSARAAKAAKPKRPKRR